MNCFFFFAAIFCPWLCGDAHAGIVHWLCEPGQWGWPTSSGSAPGLPELLTSNSQMFFIAFGWEKSLVLMHIPSRDISWNCNRIVLYITIKITRFMLIMNYRLYCRLIEGPRGLDALIFFFPFLPLQPVVFICIALLSNQFLENGKRS